MQIIFAKIFTQLIKLYNTYQFKTFKKCHLQILKIVVYIQIMYEKEELEKFLIKQIFQKKVKIL
jgi:hypothetical protein